MAHHLANEVQKHFAELDCDLDVIKVNLDRRRPDIILHKRGSHDSNFLVIEVKRDGSSAAIRDDIDKIMHYWFNNPLCYKFGAVINLKSNKTGQVQVFNNS